MCENNSRRVGITDLRFSRARPYRARLRDATRRAKRAAEAAGQTNGRASAATASWPALDPSLERRTETVRTVIIRNSRVEVRRGGEVCGSNAWRYREVPNGSSACLVGAAGGSR